MNKIRVFEAFAGIGSQAMALKNIGGLHEIVGVCEVDKNAIIGYDAIHSNDSYEMNEVSKDEMLDEFARCNIGYNFSTGKSEIPRSLVDIKKLYESHIRIKNYGDIRKIDPTCMCDIDLFTYSFPCKNISMAGQQKGFEKGGDTQSSLVWDCEKIIIEKLPKVLLMENVKNIVGKKHIEKFKEWCDFLSSVGYVNSWKVLNAKDYGVPQNRERVMMVSVLNAKTPFVFPTGRRLPTKIKDILEDFVDEKFFVNKPFELVCKGHQAEFLGVKREESRRIYSEENKTMRTLKSIERGQNNILVRARLSGNRMDRTRVMDSDGICPTIDSMNGGNREPKIFCEEEYRVRKLTPLECWRLMGFSDVDFNKAKKSGLSNSKLYERAGRGICVPMLEDLFIEIYKQVWGKSIATDSVEKMIKMHKD